MLQEEKNEGKRNVALPPWRREGVKASRIKSICHLNNLVSLTSRRFSYLLGMELDR